MKTPTIVITSLISILTLMNCNGQTKKTTDDPSPANKVPDSTDNTTTKSIVLGNYMIDPVKKTISHQQYWERDEPNGNHAWGTEYKIDEDIDFETTCLYIMEDNLMFKEHYIPQEQPKFMDDDDNPLDISAYTNFDNSFYEKDGIYSVLDNKIRHRLHEIAVESGIHIPSLTAAGQNYFYNDKGLYYVRYGTNGLILITVCKAKNCRPKVRGTYCEYNGEIFVIDWTVCGGNPKKLNANPAKLYEIDKNRDGNNLFLTDGTTVFLTNGYSLLGTDYDPEDKKVPGLNRWKQLSTGQALSVENNCVNLSASAENESTAYDPLFFLPGEGFFTVNFPSFHKKEHYAKVFILNYDNGVYEELDADRFELRVKDFFTYKDQLYYKAMPIENELDAAKLQYLRSSYKTTNWMSDGKRLIHLDVRRSGNARNRLSFGPEVLVANIKQLKVVSDELLVDGVNFYQFDGREIEVIPIESLGIEVKIDLETSASNNRSQHVDPLV